MAAAAASDGEGCARLPWPVRPINGGAAEFGWVVLHWLGTRNLLAAVARLFPSYASIFIAAAPRAEAGWRLALTIDDVLNDNTTGFIDLLALLERHTVPATFFVITNDRLLPGTEDAAQRLDLLRRASIAGHEIGNHGLKDSLMSGMDRGMFAAAIAEWERRIRLAVPTWPATWHGNGTTLQADGATELSNATPSKWFRPPRCVMSPAMVDVLGELGYRVVLGDVYADDWLIGDPPFHERILEGASCDGSVIVLHVPDRPARMQTLEILETSLPRLKARGYTFVRLTDLFADVGPAGNPTADVALVYFAVVAFCFLVCRGRLRQRWAKIVYHYTGMFVRRWKPQYQSARVVSGLHHDHDGNNSLELHENDPDGHDCCDVEPLSGGGPHHHDGDNSLELQDNELQDNDPDGHDCSDGEPLSGPTEHR